MADAVVTEEHLSDINGLVARVKRLRTQRKMGKPIDYAELEWAEDRLKRYNVVLNGDWSGPDSD